MQVGKYLVISGILIAVIGGAIMLYQQLGLPSIPFGKLPGDITIERANSKIYIPITSCVLAGILFSAISFFIKKFF